jgi:hypothetical protein
MLLRKSSTTFLAKAKCSSQWQDLGPTKQTNFPPKWKVSQAQVVVCDEEGKVIERLSFSKPKDSKNRHVVVGHKNRQPRRYTAYDSNGYTTLM